MTESDSRFDLETLEFRVVRELLFERLSTPLGRTAVEAVAPLASVEEANQRLQEAAELAQRLAAGDVPPFAGVPEVRTWLTPFFLDERIPEAREIADLKRLLRASLRCKSWLQGAGGLGRVVAMAEHHPQASDLVDELDLVLDDRGEVLSSASVKLAETRIEIEQAEAGLRGAVQRFVSDDGVRRYLQSTEPAWRHGRPVFQVKQEHRNRVPGVLHDRSQSGATLFVEPSAIVEVANRLADAKAAEQREVQVILAHVCRGLRRCRPEIDGSIAALVALDLAWAKARLVHEAGYLPVPVHADGPLVLRSARHPLLLRRAGGPVVPLDLVLGDPYRMLVVTGPNTGGKTVVLKAIGLLSLMAVSGVPIPAGTGSRVPWLDGVFADIGDEQGIAQNLSTFSGHVRRIVRCLGGATSRSLVLLDELGAGTDPEEGSALGYAVLEDLVARGVLCAVTTHLGRLKDFAHHHSRAQNGAMAFDGATLAPLYRLEVGLPGASHALDIASRVGMPANLVARARALMGKRDRRVEEVIESVTEIRRKAEEDRQRTAALAHSASQREEEVSQRLQEVERKSAWLQEEAALLVDEEMRAARSLLEAPLRELANAPRPFGEKAKALLGALEGLMRGASVHRRRMRFLGTLDKDSVVYVPRLRRRCVVKKIDRVRELLTLEVGRLRLEVPFDDVSWLQPLDEP